MNYHLFIAGLCVILASLVAYLIGRKHGIALGWCEHHFDDIEQERARRDAAGRFRSIVGKRGENAR